MKIWKLHWKAMWVTVVSILHVPNDILVKLQLIKNPNIYILEGFIVSRICSFQTCHSTDTYFNAKYENYAIKLGVELFYINISCSQWYTSEEQVIQECQYIYPGRVHGVKNK